VHGVALAMKRSGLTREQIYYVEERGYLGAVLRQGPARSYTEAQLAKLEKVAACRRMGLRLDEAGPIASAQLSGEKADIDRLRVLALAKIQQINAEMDALIYILTVIHETTGVGQAPRAA
jgi:DNA-binding transcriptional MerR regulator